MERAFKCGMVFLGAFRGAWRHKMKKKMFFILILALAAIFGGIILFGVILPGRGDDSNYSKKLVIEGETGRHEFMVEVADTIVSRARGLSGRAGLAENEGMLFVFGSSGAHGFWMRNMKFPIDIVWARGEKIVGFTENAAPEPGKSLLNLKVYYPPEPADRVLEIKAGSVEKLGLKIGDMVRVLQ